MHSHSKYVCFYIFYSRSPPCFSISPHFICGSVISYLITVDLYFCFAELFFFALYFFHSNPIQLKCHFTIFERSIRMDTTKWTWISKFNSLVCYLTLVVLNVCNAALIEHVFNVDCYYCRTFAFHHCQYHQRSTRFLKKKLQIRVDNEN